MCWLAVVLAPPYSYRVYHQGTVLRKCITPLEINSNFLSLFESRFFEFESITWTQLDSKLVYSNSNILSSFWAFLSSFQALLITKVRLKLKKARHFLFLIEIFIYVIQFSSFLSFNWNITICHPIFSFLKF